MKLASSVLVCLVLVCFCLAWDCTLCGAYAQQPVKNKQPASQTQGESKSESFDKKGYLKIAVPFLKKHCLECHQSEDAEAEFQVDKFLTNRFDDLTVKSHWEEVVNVLNGHEMPPESEAQPDASEVAKVVDWITEQLTRAELHRRSSAIVLRRLNRDEYKRTIRDLMGVDIDVSTIPQDPATGGFDNNGGALNISPIHIELYQKIARQALDKALFEGSQPDKIKWRFEPETGDSDSNRIKLDDKRHRSVIVNGGKGRSEGKFKVLYDHHWDRNNINVRTLYVPTAGDYTIRVRAGGVVPGRDAVLISAKAAHQVRLETIKSQTDNPNTIKWNVNHLQKNLDEHFAKSSIYEYGSPRFQLIQHLGGQPITRAEIDVDATRQEPKTYEFRVPFTTEAAGITIKYAYDVPKEIENAWFQNNGDFARPELWVDWLELEGPIYDSWPPPSHHRILLDSPVTKKNESKHARKVLAMFMRRAYRRPVAAKEIDAKLALFEAVRKDSTSFVEAIKTPLIAVLVSPNFLYLTEPGSPVVSTEAPEVHKPRELNSHELASRLSYFLWSTMPDDELLKLGSGNKLKDKAVLLQQVDRMLLDPRAQAFNKNFAGQWLGAREVGANPPVPDRFPRYDRHLEISLVAEIESFFAEILENDLSITNFIDSDFVVVNERLARFYQIDGVEGDHFRKVKVPKSVHRGGVLTQAGFLSTTSNGTRTQPVTRGRWVMNNIFGVDPGIPVANVGEISPKVPGIDKATVRQRLELHRELPQCARCHNRIDPLGLALENYNAAGEWRDREGFGYKGRVEKDDPLIDASSKMLDGTKIEGVEGLKKELLKQKDLFYKCLAGKMMTYALGRELGVTDQKYLDAAAAELNKNDDTLRTLIKYVVTSQPFQTK